MPDAPRQQAAGGIRVLGGRYRLERLIARGGMADLWESTDEILARPVAVKVLQPALASDPAFVERFRGEAIAAARLVHPNIVAVYDTGVDGDDAYIVMELVRGPDLRTLLQRHHGRLDPPAAVSLVAQVADALHFAHEQGVVHRDVKPANILCDGDRAKVADFGIAKAAATADLTRPGAVVGTLAYVSPEQVAGGAVDRRSDVFSLGVVLYELLCGRRPFEADTDVGAAVARLQRTPLRPRQVRAGIPRSLDAVVMRALARDPQDRFQTAAELRAALLAVDLRDDDAVPLVESDPTPPGGTVASFRESERSWLVPAIAILLIAAALITAGVVLSQSDIRPFRRSSPPATAAAPAATPVALAGATAFDPLGDGDEHGDEAGLAVDGDPSTAWTTSTYSRADFGGLKAGVGLVVELAEPAALRRLEVTTPTPGWQAEVYLADAAARSLPAWGSPVGSLDARGRDAAVDLGGRRAGAVLIWLTSLGRDGGGFGAEIAEVRVVG